MKGFYSELSLIMREFLAETDRRWGLDLTTLQLMAVVSQDGLAETDVRTLEALLSEADLVKFAGVHASEQEVRRSSELALRFLEETRENAPMIADPDAVEEGRGDVADVSVNPAPDSP